MNLILKLLENYKYNKITMIILIFIIEISL